MTKQKRAVRLPVAELLGQVRSKSGFVRGKWSKARVLQFSGEMVTLSCDQAFKSGDQIQIALMLVMDVGRIAVDRINCNVEDSRLVNGEVIIKVTYTSDQDDFTKRGLARLERISSRCQKLSERWLAQGIVTSTLGVDEVPMATR
jgi:hypothetical protein